MIALKSLSTNNQEDLFKEFGFDSKKVTFEAERYLGKEISVSKKLEDNNSGRHIDNKAMVTDNPFAEDLTALSAGDAADFFSQLGNEAAPKQEKAEEKLKPEREASNNNMEMMPQVDPSNLVQETVSRNMNWN